MVIAYGLYSLFHNDSNVVKGVYTNWASSFWTLSVSINELIRQFSIIFMGNPDMLNPPIWYLKWEVLMFLLMPLFVSNFNKYNKFLVITFGFLFSYGVWSIVVVYIIGMLAHYMLDKYEISSIIKKKTWIFFICILGISLLNINNYDLSFIEESFVSLIVQSIGACLIICVLYENPLFLYNRFLKFIGDISYEFYLIHFVLILVFRRYFDNNTILVFIILTFLMTLVLSLLLHKFINLALYKYVKVQNN